MLALTTSRDSRTTVVQHAGIGGRGRPPTHLLKIYVETIPICLRRPPLPRSRKPTPTNAAVFSLARWAEIYSHRHRSLARAGNTRTDSAHNRYNIDPKDLVRIQREGRNRGDDIVGFYHSHPDHPAQWSKTDFAEAHWFGCSYVITSVEKGKCHYHESFELAGTEEADKKFLNEKIEIT